MLRRDLDPIGINYNPEETYPPADFDALPLRSWPEQWHPTAIFETPQSVGQNPFRQVTDRQLSFDQSGASYRLGEPSLPVAPYREYFISTVEQNQSVIVSSETGSGKSSQLGLYLLEAGYPRVLVSSPRIVAARELKEWAQHNLGPEYRHLAGYLTGTEEDSDCGPDARLIYITEQLLFKMVNRGQLRPDDVIINDEAHERTTGTVVLLGLMKELLAEQEEFPGLKLIVSSATIDTAKFSSYLADPYTLEPAPIMVLPGRTHSVETVDSELSVADSARKLMRAGHNVLAFEPGHARIRETWRQMASHQKDRTVHKLYGDQSPAEQKEALNPADGNDIVASRIGETSLTPQGKTAVVDSGLSNLGTYRQGVRGLMTTFSSKATMVQRKGRVGRTAAGVYVRAIPEKAPPPIAYEDRDDYDPPAIQNSPVTAFVAELLARGRQLEDLDLLEEPTYENLAYDHQLLKRLGAIALDEGNYVITDIGRAMTEFPLDSPLARMMVEARRLATAEDGHDDEALRLQVAAVAAMRQVNGILGPSDDGRLRYMLSRRHEEKLSLEQTSDVLYELDAFTKMFSKHQELIDAGIDDVESKLDPILRSRGVLPNRYYKSLRTFRELCRREGLVPEELAVATFEQRKDIIGCQIAGTEELFVQKSKQRHWDIRGNTRQLGRRSTIAPPLANLVVGTAFDYFGMRDNGLTPPKLYISGASAVSLPDLIKHAPERIIRETIGHGIARDGQLRERQALFFDGTQHFAEELVEPSPSLETREFIISAMMTGLAASTDDPNRLVPFNPQTPRAIKAIKRYREALALDNSSHAKLDVAKRYQELVRKVIVESILDGITFDITDPSDLDQYIPEVYVNALVRPKRRKDIPSIVRTAPDGIALHNDQDKKTYVPVTYRNGIAYVTIDRAMQYSVKREDFESLEEFHYVKIRVNNKQYQTIETAFDRFEELRNSPGRIRRQKRREEIEAREEVQFEVIQSQKVLRGRRKKYNGMAPKIRVPIKSHRPRIVKKIREAKSKETREVVR
jgi:hypothetical protein